MTTHGKFNVYAAQTIGHFKKFQTMMHVQKNITQNATCINVISTLPDQSNLNLQLFLALGELIKNQNSPIACFQLWYMNIFRKTSIQHLLLIGQYSAKSRMKCSVKWLISHALLQERKEICKFTNSVMGKAE
jgi:hypothetical protein